MATTTYVALLRAVNVGGTGKLAMADLKMLCEKAGLRDVRTYVASGNAVFASEGTAGDVKKSLEAALGAYMGKTIGVIVRTGAEIAAALASNPFPDASPSQVVAIFLDEAPPENAAEGVTGRNDEEITCGRREIYVHYPSGMGRTKLKIKAAKTGTARNMNTVAKLAEMAAANT